MNKIEHLLVCLVEECAEVQKEATKSLRFGLDDFNPTVDWAKTNRIKLEEELIDLFGILEMLVDEGIISGDSTADVKPKIAKVKKYMEYAREKGTLI